MNIEVRLGGAGTNVLGHKVLPSCAGVLEYVWGAMVPAGQWDHRQWHRIRPGVLTAAVEMPAAPLAELLTFSARFTVPGMLPAVAEGSGFLLLIL